MYRITNPIPLDSRKNRADLRAGDTCGWGRMVRMSEESDGVVWLEPLALLIGGYRSPIESTYLTLEDPLTVLYGLNGAGKSFVLDALRSCLRGITSPRMRSTTTYVLARVPEDYERWPIGLSNAFKSVTNEEVVPGHFLYERLTERLRTSWQPAWDLGYHDDLPIKDELAEEFGRSGLMLIRPVGLEI